MPIVTKLRSLWLPISVWIALLVVLVVGLQLLSVGSVVQGGALGAFCGATLVVVFAIHERNTTKDESPVHPRYRS